MFKKIRNCKKLGEEVEVSESDLKVLVFVDESQYLLTSNS